MKFRKGVYKGLSSVLISGSMVMAIAGSALADVKDVSGHWAQAQITKWVDKGYISGYADGTFKPNNSITRAEFMTLVNKSFGLLKKPQ
ncbi:S-layer homology domain-containing protein [Aneurinibacillus sp. Ricciae_BoGa-3]|uniref:S-layer homology domain-containing protein n=1 Tax=Aneurinibacillus sp. Ricciae_BoGa-3 TaxID=3022697 RepID=UPI0023411018|nr:S-layer homology domain-containing protein [Aneurinibacillus sp. Ricciae_BoGa-3]WCK54300.1 S-layer homology domain-containing protein [Aneurinibacillus sp. Ricciae_BoGa-3]